MPSGNFGGQPHSAVRRKRLAAGQGDSGENCYSAEEKMATDHDPSLFNWRAVPSGEPHVVGSLGCTLSGMPKADRYIIGATATSGSAASRPPNGRGGAETQPSTASVVMIRRHPYQRV